MIETDDLLVKCPRCGAWPMAVGSQRSTLAEREVTFRCTRCGSKETGRLRRSASSRVDEHRGLDAA